MATPKALVSRFIECGKIINTHGCRGDVKVEPWTDTPRDLIDLGRVFMGDGEDKKEIRILRGSVMQGRFLMLTLEGVDLTDAHIYVIDQQRLMSWAPNADKIDNNTVMLIEFERR